MDSLACLIPISPWHFMAFGLSINRFCAIVLLLNAHASPYFTISGDIFDAYLSFQDTDSVISLWQINLASLNDDPAEVIRNQALCQNT